MFCGDSKQQREAHFAMHPLSSLAFKVQVNPSPLYLSSSPVLQSVARASYYIARQKESGELKSRAEQHGCVLQHANVPHDDDHMSHKQKEHQS